MSMKMLALVLSLLLLAGCSSSGIASLFRIIPTDTEVCPHGHDPVTNQCNP